MLLVYIHYRKCETERRRWTSQQQVEGKRTEHKNKGHRHRERETRNVIERRVADRKWTAIFFFSFFFHRNNNKKKQKEIEMFYKKKYILFFYYLCFFLHLFTRHIANWRKFLYTRILCVAYKSL